MKILPLDIENLIVSFDPHWRDCFKLVMKQLQTGIRWIEAVAIWKMDTTLEMILEQINKGNVDRCMIMVNYHLNEEPNSWNTPPRHLGGVCEN